MDYEQIFKELFVWIHRVWINSAGLLAFADGLN